MSEEIVNCIICDICLSVDCRYPVFQSLTPHSGILLKDFLHKISRVLFKERDEIEEHSYLCKTCFSLLEQFDLSEFSLIEIKKQINIQLEKKYGKEYLDFPQFVEVACQTEEILLSISDNVLDEIKLEHFDEHDENSVERRKEKRKPSRLQDNGKSFQCKHCTNHYSSKTGLNNHVIKKHKSVENEIIPSVDLQPVELEIKIETTEGDTEIKTDLQEIQDKSFIGLQENEDEDFSKLPEDENFIIEYDERIDGDSNDSDYVPLKKVIQQKSKRKRGRPSTVSQKHKPNSTSDLVDNIAKEEIKSADADSGSDYDDKPLTERFKLNIKSEEKWSDNSDSECNQRDNFLAKKRRRGRPKKTSESDGIVIKPYIYQCPQCPKKWRTKSELRIHLVSHSDVRAHVCDICGQAYKKRAALDIHIGMHAGINPYTCNICGKVFTQKGALNRHLPIHTGEANYQCDLCGKRFIHHTSFSMHALTHSGLKAYKCEICGLGLMSTSHLKRHMRAHSGEKKYGCSQCGKRFAERYNLAAHERLHFAPGEKRKRTHPCPLCGDTFQRRQKLEEHLASNHNKILDSDESRKWAGLTSNSSGVVPNINDITGTQSAWPMFVASGVFPQTMIKSPPDETLNDSTEISSS